MRTFALACMGLCLRYATWGAQSGVPEAKARQRIDALVEALRDLAIDPARDGLGELLEKRDRAEKLVAGFAAQLVAEMARAEQVATDYVRFVVATAPRLSGRIVTIGADGAFPDLEAAEILPGDTVVLQRGRHQLPSGRRWQDVAFVGVDRAECVVRGQVGGALRVRLDDLTIDCNNHPFDLRNTGSLHVRRCTIGNSNSGGGGSNAWFSSGGVLLVEASTFDGSEGRAKGPDRFGTVFDLRGRHALHARDCLFRCNDEILRATSDSTFERCRVDARAAA